MTLTGAVAMPKGGAGKSMSTANFGVAAARRGHRTLLMDMDPSALLTWTFFGRKFADEECVTSILRDYMDPSKVIHAVPAIPNLFIVPSNSNFDGAEKNLSPEEKLRALPLMHDWSVDRHEYDFKLFDTPPEDTIMGRMGLYASDFLLATSAPSPDDVRDLERIPKIIAEINEAHPDRAPLEWTKGGILLVQVLNGELHPSIRGMLTEKFAALVLGAVPGTPDAIQVKTSTVYQVANANHRPVCCKPGCAHAIPYEEALRELFRRNGLTLGDTEKEKKAKERKAKAEAKARRAA